MSHPEPSIPPTPPSPFLHGWLSINATTYSYFIPKMYLTDSDHGSNHNDHLISPSSSSTSSSPNPSSNAKIPSNSVVASENQNQNQSHFNHPSNNKNQALNLNNLFIPKSKAKAKSSLSTSNQNQIIHDQKSQSDLIDNLNPSVDSLDHSIDHTDTSNHILPSTIQAPTFDQLKKNLKLDINLLEIITRSVLLNLKLIDLRQDHQETINLLDKFKNLTSGLHPTHNEIYKTKLDECVQRVRSIQSQLDLCQSTIDPDLTEKIQEIVKSQFSSFNATNPLKDSWLPKPVEYIDSIIDRPPIAPSNSYHSPNQTFNPSRSSISNPPNNQTLNSFQSNSHQNSSSNDPWGDWGQNDEPIQSQSQSDQSQLPNSASLWDSPQLPSPNPQNPSISRETNHASSKSNWGAPANSQSDYRSAWSEKDHQPKIHERDFGFDSSTRNDSGRPFRPRGSGWSDRSRGGRGYSRPDRGRGFGPPDGPRNFGWSDRNRSSGFSDKARDSGFSTRTGGFGRSDDRSRNFSYSDKGRDSGGWADKGHDSGSWAAKDRDSGFADKTRGSGGWADKDRDSGYSDRKRDSGGWADKDRDSGYSDKKRDSSGWADTTRDSSGYATKASNLAPPGDKASDFVGWADNSKDSGGWAEKSRDSNEPAEKAKDFNGWADDKDLDGWASTPRQPGSSGKSHRDPRKNYAIEKEAGGHGLSERSAGGGVEVDSIPLGIDESGFRSRKRNFEECSSGQADESDRNFRFLDDPGVEHHGYEGPPKEVLNRKVLSYGSPMSLTHASSLRSRAGSQLGSGLNSRAGSQVPSGFNHSLKEEAVSEIGSATKAEDQTQDQTRHRAECMEAGSSTSNQNQQAHSELTAHSLSKSVASEKINPKDLMQSAEKEEAVEATIADADDPWGDW
ncbi:hypothetical protein O181_043851 [Austropuccinia psidii MF-1]|uniref:Uncharacterized protein n=1 Tax=Austropuccinia psidii MF-1 TaxID=1389203 RepID=A0A9Q3DHG4_9BASI|nr:hypothetical protein [Austropuccinia psidii MF-1]